MIHFQSDESGKFKLHTDKALLIRVREAVVAFKSMAPEEQIKMMKAQRRSWVRGELRIAHPEMTEVEADAIIDLVIGAENTRSTFARDEALEDIKRQIIDLTKKWGNPNGSYYEQGAQDHANRIVAVIDRTLQSQGATSSAPACFSSLPSGESEPSVTTLAVGAEATTREALADLVDAFLSRHGCFPCDETNDKERHWKRALRAYDKYEAETCKDDRFWLILREPGCVPEKKGSWPANRITSILREFMQARPGAFITVLSMHRFSGPIVDDAPQVLEILDGRSSGVAKRHRETSAAAFAKRENDVSN